LEATIDTCYGAIFQMYQDETYSHGKIFIVNIIMLMSKRSHQKIVHFSPTTKLFEISNYKIFLRHYTFCHMYFHVFELTEETT